MMYDQGNCRSSDFGTKGASSPGFFSHGERMNGIKALN